MTKTQLYANLKASNYIEHLIISDCSSLGEIKSNLVHYANKHNCLLRQKGTVKYYLGSPYYREDSDRWLDAVNSIASKLGYVIYSPNGCWFIK